MRRMSTNHNAKAEVRQAVNIASQLNRKTFVNVAA